MHDQEVYKMTKLHELAKLGQSIWLDNIQRSLITSGELQSLIDNGLRGITSNPVIFEKAISNSTKNPDYPDTLYVDSLIGPDTVNTLPPATLKAFLEHGQVGPTVNVGLEDARASLAKLSDVGVDLDEINLKLLDKGVASFEEAFESLIASIAKKSKMLLVN